MNVAHDLSILALIWNASVIVQAVIALLLVVSFMSWYFIFYKIFSIRRARGQLRKERGRDSVSIHRCGLRDIPRRPLGVLVGGIR